MRTPVLLSLIIAIYSCKEKHESAPITGQDNNFGIKLQAANGFTVYSNSDYGFHFEYPAGWDSSPKDPNVLFIAVEKDPDSSDHFNEGLNISAAPLQGFTMDSIVNANIALAHHFYKNADIKKAVTVNSSGVNCTVLQMPMIVEGMQLITYTAFFEDGTHFYTLTQTFEVNKGEKYEPIVEHVINSFNWNR